VILGYLLLMLLLGLFFLPQVEPYRRIISYREVKLRGGWRERPWWRRRFGGDSAGRHRLVYTQECGQLLWWSFLPSGMMTVFLFARLWKRSGLLTDVQFAEMRYTGNRPAFLRGFRAIYLGVLMKLPDSRWVHGDDQHRGSVLGKKRKHESGHLHFLPDSVHGILCFAGGLWGVL